MSLWLPSELVMKLTNCLVREGGLGSLKRMLIEIRKLLLRDKAGDLTAENIVAFAKLEDLK